MQLQLCLSARFRVGLAGALVDWLSVVFFWFFSFFFLLFFAPLPCQLLLHVGAEWTAWWCSGAACSSSIVAAAPRPAAPAMAAVSGEDAAQLPNFRHPPQQRLTISRRPSHCTPAELQPNSTRTATPSRPIALPVRLSSAARQLHDPSRRFGSRPSPPCTRCHTVSE